MLDRGLKRILFIEVKYRKVGYYGEGYEFVTKAKMAQMEKAAKQFLWQAPDYESHQPILKVASVNGDGDILMLDVPLC
jgi:Holliday junction resolvase-like predicted endonuclease